MSWNIGVRSTVCRFIAEMYRKSTASEDPRPDLYQNERINPEQYVDEMFDCLPISWIWIMTGVYDKDIR